MSEQQPDVDLPEPEQVLSEGIRTPDHDPIDRDDREVPLDDPDQRDPSIDDGDRETAGG